MDARAGSLWHKTAGASITREEFSNVGPRPMRVDQTDRNTFQQLVPAVSPGKWAGVEDYLLSLPSVAISSEESPGFLGQNTNEKSWIS